MSTQTLIATMPWGEKLKLSVDLAQASAPISYEGDGEWVSAPFQTADARHDETSAVRLLLDWFGRDYYAQPDDDRDGDEILDEVMEGVTIEYEEEDEEEEDEVEDEDHGKSILVFVADRSTGHDRAVRLRVPAGDDIDVFVDRWMAGNPTADVSGWAYTA